MQDVITCNAYAYYIYKAPLEVAFAAYFEISCQI